MHTLHIFRPLAEQPSAMSPTLDDCGSIPLVQTSSLQRSEAAGHTSPLPFSAIKQVRSEIECNFSILPTHRVGEITTNATFLHNLSRPVSHTTATLFSLFAREASLL